MRLIAALLLVILTATQAMAERPRAGILWNRSGLPATMPLQVRTLPGQDHVVFLIDPDSGEAKMAGYIRGGAFFRLLVPPGTFLLRFATGTEWQGEEDLFGDETIWTDMDKPLSFGIAGIGRRQGHVVRLIRSDGSMKVVTAGTQTLCQLAMWDSEVKEWPTDSDLIGQEIRSDLPVLRYLDLTLNLRTRLCD